MDKGALCPRLLFFLPATFIITRMVCRGNCGLVESCLTSMPSLNPPFIRLSVKIHLHLIKAGNFVDCLCASEPSVTVIAEFGNLSDQMPVA